MNQQVSPQVSNASLQAELITSIDDIQKIKPQWQDLCTRSRSPNAFFEPCFLLPALAHLNESTVSLLVVWADESKSSLLAIVPLKQQKTYFQLPLANTTIWRHPYCFLCSPLIDSTVSDSELLHCLHGLSQAKQLAQCFALSWLDEMSPFGNAESDFTHENWRFHRHSSARTRAGLHLRGTHSDYLQSLRTKKRKDLFRTRRRLMETGDYHSTVITGESPVELQQSTLDEFLQLENQGWKQEQGSSIASAPAHEQYFRSAMRSGLEQNQVLLARLSLDQQPIAILVVLLSACGRAGYTQKLAIDTQFDRYSPGSLAILELTEYVYSSTLPVRLLDSCAAPNHPMIDSLWRDRLALHDVTILRQNSWRNAMISLTGTARNLKKKITKEHLNAT